MSGSEARLAAIDIVMFRAGGRWFGVEADQVRGSQPLDDTTGVRDCEALLGLVAPSQGAQRLAMAVKVGTGDRRVAVDAPLELRTVDVADIHPLPALLAARSRLPRLRALALVGDGMVPLVDLSAAVEAAA